MALFLFGPQFLSANCFSVNFFVALKLSLPSWQRYGIPLLCTLCHFQAHQITMGDEEPRAKRSRFDQTEPEPRRQSRFDRRSRSPSSRQSDSTRQRSPLSREPRSPGKEEEKRDEKRDEKPRDPAAAAGKKAFYPCCSASKRDTDPLRFQRPPQPKSMRSCRQRRESSMWTCPRSVL